MHWVSILKKMVSSSLDHDSCEGGHRIAPGANGFFAMPASLFVNGGLLPGHPSGTASIFQNVFMQLSYPNSDRGTCVYDWRGL